MSYRNIIYQKKKDNTYIVFLPSGNVDVERYRAVKEVIDVELSL